MATSEEPSVTRVGLTGSPKAVAIHPVLVSLSLTLLLKMRLVYGTLGEVGPQMLQKATMYGGGLAAWTQLLALLSLGNAGKRLSFPKL